jgi:hypothetical protein
MCKRKSSLGLNLTNRENLKDGERAQQVVFLKVLFNEAYHTKMGLIFGKKRNKKGKKKTYSAASISIDDILLHSFFLFACLHFYQLSTKF